MLGRDRQGAGSRADAAVTGLALLAFLGSGHTHLDGPYHEDVRRALEYLMRTQAPDGNSPARRPPSSPCTATPWPPCRERGVWNDARRPAAGTGPPRHRRIPSPLRTPGAAAGATSPAKPATPANSAGS